jgi:hypothetical protein
MDKRYTCPLSTLFWVFCLYAVRDFRPVSAKLLDPFYKSTNFCWAPGESPSVVMVGLDDAGFWTIIQNLIQLRVNLPIFF